MLKLGIVGAESSHSVEISKIFNVDRLVPGRIVAIWGETKAFAEAAASQCQIPEIVRHPPDLIGKVDGVMIDHRHAKYHAETAALFVQAGIPCFVDKPFTYTLDEARRLCDLAARFGVAVTTFSIIPIQKSYQRFCKSIQDLGPLAYFVSSGPADLKSKYGGVFFYGVHQVDAMVEALGTAADTVEVLRHGKEAVAVITYRHGPIVTMNMVNNGNSSFHWTAIGSKGQIYQPLEFDANAYLAGARIFSQLVRTNRPIFPVQRMLAPIAVLEAMQKAIRTGRRQKVAIVD